jgi:HAD superfamily hydrolase (TIGR01490 family)
MSHKTAPMNQTKPFAVFDIDGTLIRWQLYHAVVNALAKAGLLGESAYDEIRNYRMPWKQRQHPDSFKKYEYQLVEFYDQAIKGINLEQFEAAARDVINEYKDQTYVFTRELVKSLKQKGYILLAISGSQDTLITVLGEYYGFTESIGSTYINQKGHFTGEKIVASQNKAVLLSKLVKKHNLSFKNSVGVGDTLSDATFLNMVEKPIAFNPDAALFEAAKKNKWKIVIERKNVIYELNHSFSGYRLK